MQGQESQVDQGEGDELLMAQIEAQETGWGSGSADAELVEI